MPEQSRNGVRRVIKEGKKMNSNNNNSNSRESWTKWDSKQHIATISFIKIPFNENSYIAIKLPQRQTIKSNALKYILYKMRTFTWRTKCLNCSQSCCISQTSEENNCITGSCQ